MRFRNRAVLAFLALSIPAALAIPAGLPTPPDDGAAPGPSAERAPAGTAAAATGPDARADAAAPPATPAAPDGEAYLAGHFLIRPDGRDLAEIAAAIGGRVVNPEGRSGLALVASDAPDAPDVLEALGVSPRPCGRVVGATGPNSLQWHRNAVGMNTSSLTYETYKVAVLDTGVAYENYGTYVKAAGFAGVTFTSPKDYVNDDLHPNDDHQHGTHITSLIASTGAIYGTSPGVGIIPIKVLDSANSGTEWALVEGIWWAITHDADVINLSLSFPLGYVPSTELNVALAAAQAADIVVVAAAGNQAADDVSWPAAARGVIAVGARTYDGTIAPYSNTGPSVQVLAPGGRMDQDLDANGYGDGILAQTIALNDPTTTGFYWMEGTSQATALTSGAVVRLLRNGVTPDQVASYLQRKSWSKTTAATLGTGAPNLDITASLASNAPVYDRSAGILPYVTSGGQAKARVSIVDNNGTKVSDITAVVTAYTELGSEQLQCTTDANGICTVTATQTTASVSAWAFRVDGVVAPNPNNTTVQPGRAVFVSDGASNMLAAVQAQLAADDVLAVKFTAGTAAGLGSVAEAWSVVDAAPGLLGVPYGMVFLPSAATGYATTSSVTVQPQSTGLVSAPYNATLASMTLPRLEFTNGIVDPFGDLSTSAYRMFGSGLVSSPMGTIPPPPPTFRLVGLKSSTANKFDVVDLFASNHTATTNALGMGWASDSTLVDRELQFGSGGGLALIQSLIAEEPDVFLGGFNNGAALTSLDLDGASLDAEVCGDCEDGPNPGDLF